MHASDFGSLDDGRPVRRLTLGAAPGVELQLLTLGATIHRLDVTGGDGVRRNVVLGHPDPATYLASRHYLGATIGRYANRIAHGRLRIDGRETEVGTHDRGHHLHGGPDGFDRRVWQVVEQSSRPGVDRVVLRLDSPDGDQGFPGNLRSEASFEVSASRVRIDFSATTDATTVVNLTNHAYFNLDGAGAGTVDDHELVVHASTYLPVDASGIPLGDPAPVAATPFDFRRPRRIGSAVRSDHPQVVAARGLDHDLVLDGTGWRRVAELFSARTRTRLTVHSDQPGLQVYTGNSFDGSGPAADGGVHRQGDGIALEPQLHPDTPHHGEWPTAVLRPGRPIARRWEGSGRSRPRHRGRAG